MQHDLLSEPTADTRAETADTRRKLSANINPEGNKRLPLWRYTNMQSTTIDDTDYYSNVMTARTPVLTRLSDEYGVYRMFNEAWTRFTGRRSEDDDNNGWLRLVHADDRATVAAAYRQATSAQADVELQFRLLRRDGTYRWMLDRASPWRQSDGSFGGLVSACTDVTNLKAPSAANGTDRRVVRFPSVLMRLDAERRIEFVSPEVENLFEMPAANLVGKTISTANLPDAATRAFDELVQRSDRQSSTGEMPEALPSSLEIEFSVRSKDVEHHLAASAMTDASGKLFIVIHDITACIEVQNLQRESLLREELARQRAEAAARSRSQFLSVVSHELRSPLNGIQSWAHVLESQIDTERPIVQRALAGIRTGVSQQIALIEALLDATQILNGHLSLVSEAYSLNGAILSALDSVRKDAEQKNIEMVFTPTVADVDMMGDTERIQQIIRHLLSNAIKFTDDGGDVQISVKRENDVAVVTVEDNGCGIAPDFAASVFDTLVQADGSSTRRAAGLGLGLAVSRRIAELHGGSLHCESEGVGHGSTFRLVLPLPH